MFFAQDIGLTFPALAGANFLRVNFMSQTNVETFRQLIDEIPGASGAIEGKVVKGRILSIEKDNVLIDIGQTEGRVPLREFVRPGQNIEVKSGDVVEVYLERLEDRYGEAILSREKAKREEVWQVFEQAFAEARQVEGAIVERVNGGFKVDLGGIIAFLPKSHIDAKSMGEQNQLFNVNQMFAILNMDRQRGNIVVSRRKIMEGSRAEARSEIVANLSEGQIVTGVVKGIKDYGVFVDLGGIDALIHITDMSWERLNHPSELFEVGATVSAKVIRFDREKHHISLGIKQMSSDPWEGIEERYKVKNVYKGIVSNVADFGAFVQLEKGVEGLVHVSEMSWTKKNVNPHKFVEINQEVSVMVLDVDYQRRRISLGMKQCTENPWDKLVEDLKVGKEIEAPVKNVTNFGLFVGLSDDIDGIVKLSDLSWSNNGEEEIKKYNKGDVIKVKVLEMDAENERVSLGIKQLTEDPFEGAIGEIKKGVIVKCSAQKILETGIEVLLPNGLVGFIKKTELAKERTKQKPTFFNVGDEIEAKVIQVDKNHRQINLSVKAKEVDENKQAMAGYTNQETGASLGDILGVAISQAREEEK